jgi:peptidoglycan hydrolase-like protein with peptidoglycan-binding domain
MILQLIAGLALVGGLYEWTKGNDDDGTDHQSHTGVSPDGTPVTTVVPVAKNTPVTKAQANPTNYVPSSVPPATGPLVISPIVISPTGASTVTVSSIKDVQNALNTLGFGPLNPDGVLGQLTKNAIVKYQLSRNFNPDGQISEGLKYALNADLMNLASPNRMIGQSPQVTSATVVSAAQLPIVTNKDIQHALNLLGANPQLKEDGIIGPKTVAAISAFELLHGMKIDGIASPAVRTALQLALNNPVGPPSLMHGEFSHNNYHPDRPHYWEETPFVPGVDEDNAGIYFSDARQRLLRNDDEPVAFSCENDYDF